ncbi:MAG: TMEM43 family protein [Rhizobiaceae bacterium]|nr:TMEM43 family protein [Rhizobiaceae bacterium]MCV0405362.1 TMEM43 family protein [Rhizobiaceae bacterium]
MSDQITRVTSESWFSRLGNSFAGIGIGFVLVIASIAGLAWNENRAVQTARSLTEGAGAVIALDDQGHARDANGERIDSTGMLVHASGSVSGQVPSDTELGGPIVPDNTTRLVRTVEMFQWKENKQSETRKKLGGGTETVTRYTYSQAWSAKPIESGRFEEPTGHRNPPMPVEGHTFAVDRDLALGERSLTIPARHISGIGTERSLPISEEQARAIARMLGTALPATSAAGTAYFGYDPSRPRIGDFRISYKAATADTASVVAGDGGTAFTPWVSSNGREIFLIRDGIVSASAMFERAQQSNATFTWILRLVGIVAMLIGFRTMLGIFGVIGDVIPFVGSITRFATGLVALVLTLILAPLTIGIAWIAVRPLLGGAIIAVGLALAGGLWFVGRKKAAGSEGPAHAGGAAA